MAGEQHHREGFQESLIKSERNPEDQPFVSGFGLRVGSRRLTVNKLHLYLRAGCDEPAIHEAPRCPWGPAALHPFGCNPGKCWGTLSCFILTSNLTLWLLSHPMPGGCSSQLCADTPIKKPQPKACVSSKRRGEGWPCAAILHAGALAGWL